jgi:hypothetical protein
MWPSLLRGRSDLEDEEEFREGRRGRGPRRESLGRLEGLEPEVDLKLEVLEVEEVVRELELEREELSLEC